MKRPLISKIHIAKKQLGLDDTTYRALLKTATGKTSCADMSVPELEVALAAFKNKGFKVRKGKGKKLSPASGTAKLAEIDKIRAIWITMHKQGFVQNGSEQALSAYAKRMTAKLNKGRGVEAVGWLDPRQAWQVLESLKKWHMRLMSEDMREKGYFVVRPRSGYVYVADAYDVFLEKAK